MNEVVWSFLAGWNARSLFVMTTLPMARSTRIATLIALGAFIFCLLKAVRYV